MASNIRPSTFILLSILLAVTLVLASCGASEKKIDDSSNSNDGVISNSNENTDEHATGTAGSDISDNSNVLNIEVTAKQFEFIPSTIRVKQGDTVWLHVKSIDVTHGLVIPEFGINEQLSPNEDVHVKFVADKKGTFPFACSVPCGSGHGKMQGQIIVE